MQPMFGSRNSAAKVRSIPGVTRISLSLITSRSWLACLGHRFEAVVLGVGVGGFTGYEHAGGDAREFSSDPLDDLQRGIGGLIDAEENFEFRVVLAEKAPEVFVEAVVQSAERFQDRYRGEARSLDGRGSASGGGLADSGGRLRRPSRSKPARPPRAGAASSRPPWISIYSTGTLPSISFRISARNSGTGLAP